MNKSKKILAVDTFYYENRAKTVGILFSDWGDKEPERIITSWSEEFGPYVPGEFYLRELPPTLKLLQEVNLEEVGTLILDGFLRVWDKNTGKVKSSFEDLIAKGVGEEVTLIGIAKSDFGGTGMIKRLAEKWVRGPKGSKPLWVQARGEWIGNVMKNLKRMSGEFRLPDMLRILDKETKV